MKQFFAFLLFALVIAIIQAKPLQKKQQKREWTTTDSPWHHESTTDWRTSTRRYNQSSTEGSHWETTGSWWETTSSWRETTNSWWETTRQWSGTPSSWWGTTRKWWWTTRRWWGTTWRPTGKSVLKKLTLSWTNSGKLSFWSVFPADTKEEVVETLEKL